jgi:hypothetical protein
LATQEEIDALPDELAVPLRKPIKVGEQEYLSLTFHEPTAGQLKEAGRHDAGVGTVVLLAAMAGVIPLVIDKLPAREFKRAAAFAESFMQDAQPTGADA